jgi:flavodoxin
MKIAVIVHSKTGTTLKAGNLFAGKLREKGHSADVIELKTDPPVNTGSTRSHPQFKITNLPDCKDYDAVLIGGPVWAFSASPVIYEAIKALEGVGGKKVVPFVTHGIPLAFMGGKQAIELMSKTASERGANVLEGIMIGRSAMRPDNLDKAASEILRSLG